MTNLNTQARRLIEEALREHGVEDTILAEKLFEIVFLIRSSSAHNAENDLAGHPAIQMCKRITGRMPEPILWAELIEFFGPEPDEAEYREAYAAWCMKGRDPKDYTWRKWAKSKRRTWNGGGNGNSGVDQVDRRVNYMREALKQWQAPNS